MALSFFTKLSALTLLAAVEASPSARRLGTRTSSASTEIASNAAIIKSGTMSWLGNNIGTSSSCGDQYTDGTMYAVVGSGLHTCQADTKTWVSITCNGKTVPAIVVDSCDDCDASELKVQTSVYEACGFETTDSGVQTGIDFTFQR